MSMFLKTIIWKIEQDEYLLCKFLLQDFEYTVKVLSIEDIVSSLTLSLAWNKLSCWKKKKERKLDPMQHFNFPPIKIFF